MTNPKAAVLIIGNEILSGRTIDSNTSHIALALGEIGILLGETRTIPDKKEIIVDTIREIRTKYDYIFTTGGIGPTHDDITSEAMAVAFDKEYCLHDDAYRIVKNLYERQNLELTEPRKKMAYMPSSAELIPNEGTSPGFIIENVYVLAGVPSIMQSMLRTVLPSLKKGQVVKSKQVEVMIGESTIAKELEELQNQYSDVDIGSYPFNKGGKYGTNLVLRSGNYDLLEKAYEDVLVAFKKYIS